MIAASPVLRLARLSVFEDDSTNKNRPWADFDALPRLKFRHLLENGKSRIVDGDTIANIESNIPSFRAEARKSYEETLWNALNGFNNDPKMKHLRHDSDAGKAHRAEFALLTDMPLSMAI
ncbi:hypothetical protein BGZ80_003763 [Entomortierella chlamydospora]|uniref:Uncharacterized protein n=1 Tax=Entomortierella chlamydospora TaxID=101097 RepID=A0A9P6N1T2_9FUNG|nr:hypothetical protein BGZ80_003763 [Entomortierella chlamydospora]